MPVDPVTFAATVVGLFSRNTPQDPIIATYNVDATGQVRTDLKRESGRTGGAWLPVFQKIFTNKVDPAFTEYIRNGTIPTNADVLKLFRTVKGELDTIRASGIDTPVVAPDFGSSDTPEDFRPIIRPPGGSPLPGDPFDDEDAGDIGRIYGGPHVSPIGAEDFFVPRFVRSIPGGAAGFAQQTPAGQRQMFGGARSSAPRRKRANGARRRRPRASSGSSRRRNSRAARGTRRKPRPGTKAWMTYIRGLRKK